MPPKRKSSQIQPEDSFDQISHNVHDFAEKAVSPQEIPVEQPPKKKTRKPRTTKKKDLSLQEGSNIIDLSTSPVIKAEHEEVTPIRKKPGRKPKVKQEIVEKPHEQQQQQHTTNTLTTTTPQHQLLFINATPEGPVKRKPGRKPKAKKQEEEQQSQQQPLLEEKIIQLTPASSSPAAIRNLINLDDVPPYGFNKSEVKSESQNNNSSIVPPPVVQPPITPITTSIDTSISTATPPVAATSKRGRPKKVKVDSQTIDVAMPDITESQDAKPAPVRKRKPRKQEVSAEIGKPSEIISGETSTFQEQVSLQQQKQEEVEQPAISAKAVSPTKKRRTKKQDAVPTTQSTNSIEQAPLQNEKQPLVKTTKRGRPKKIKSNDTMVEKPTVSEETVSVKMEKESDVVELGLQHHKSSINADSQIPSVAKAEHQKLVDSIKSNVGPKNSSVVLNEEVEVSEHQEQKKPPASVTQLQEQDNTTEVVRNKEKIVNSPVCEQNAKRKCSLDVNDNDNEDSDQPTPKKLSRTEEVKAKYEIFKKLKSRMDEGESANRKEVYEEHQRKKTNPKEIIRQERKREEAEKLLAKQQAEERGEDHERSQFWGYSAESVEKWEKKQEKKAKKSDVAFTDYNQVAHKKYKKQINELKPDLVTYNEQKAAAIASSSLITTEDGQIISVDTESAFYRDANSLQYASVDNQPSSEAIDRVVTDVNKTIAKREKSSRQKTINEDDDITYINERNRRFNEKIGRFYDKYTKEIKENFERGTAL